MSGNVKVQQGGALNDRGAVIRGNLQTQNALWIELTGGGTITGNLQVQGLTGAPSGSDNYLCDTTVGGNVQVQYIGKHAPVDIGDFGACSGEPGLTIGGSLQLQLNAAPVTADENTVEGSILVQLNAAPVTADENTVKGSIQVQWNAAPVTVGQNTANGNIKVQNNYVGGGTLTQNTAGGDCQLQNNSPLIIGNGNSGGTGHQNTCNNGVVCPASGLCDTGTVFSPDGSASADVLAISGGSPSDITISWLNPGSLPCSTPGNTGDPVDFESTGDATITDVDPYSVYGDAANTVDALYPTTNPHLCYEDTSPFATENYPSDSPSTSQLGPGGLYYGILPLCTNVYDSPPCVEYASYTGGPNSQPGYNAVGGFGSQNPNGAWSYLYAGTLFSDSDYTQSICGTTELDVWSQGTLPNNASMAANESSQPCTANSTVIVPPQTINLDPQSNANVDVRWTAPAAGSYVITGMFLGDDTNETSHPVEITDKGTPIYTNTISSYEQEDQFTLDVTVSPGDTIDFLSETGSTYTDLSTGLQATIAPRPSSAGNTYSYDILVNNSGGDGEPRTGP